MKKNPTIVKADIGEMLDVLADLWNTGVDYVDIEIFPEKNIIKLSFTDEYISEEFKDEMSTEEFYKNNKQVRMYNDIEEDLTDEYLDQLI